MNSTRHHPPPDKIKTLFAIILGLRAANGTLLWSDTVSAKIPTASGRTTAFGLAAFETTTDVGGPLVDVDYVLMEINRTIVR